MVFQIRMFATVAVSIFLLITTPVTGDTPTYGWKVQVGDSMTYCVLKRFESTDADRDGDINTLTWEITDDKGTKVNVTENTGTRIKIEITQLRDQVAFVKVIYDGKITLKESREYLFIEKTVDNKSYWEWEAETRYRDTHFDVDGYLEGDEIVFHLRENNTEYYPFHNASMEKIEKRNWRTGWLTYQYYKFSNDTSTFLEYEIGICKTPLSIYGFDLGLFVLGITILTIAITRKRRSV